MLSTLRIRNLALVEDLTLEFPSGYVVVTGETGAGKSVILGALNLLLGQRADRTLMRTGSDTCAVEAVFHIESIGHRLRPLLAETGIEPCEDDRLIVKRSINLNGANRQFVNGTPTSLAFLSSLGDCLVDVHGPHDHQSLLHPVSQLAILDGYGKLEDQVETFADLARRRSELENEKAALVVDERAFAQQVDLLRFQTNEIQGAALDPEEIRRDEEEHQRASNASALRQLGQDVSACLRAEDTGIIPQLERAGRLLNDLRRHDPSADHLIATQEQANAILRDLQTELDNYLDQIEADPSRLRELEERLASIHALKRKYGNTIEEVIAFGENAATKLSQLEGREETLARIETELVEVDDRIWNLGNQLSEQRRNLIRPLSKAIGKELAALGFKQSRFTVSLATAERGTAANSPGSPKPSLTGLDAIEFQFAPNPGEPPKPLRAIASSGEMARVMLAIKTVLAVADRIPVLVFDEVDANVGGETANAVGARMQSIADHRQVFCITHLAPVAAAASAHFLVTKEVRNQRTRTLMRALSPAERVDELTRMLGGNGQAARRHARALLRGRL